MIRRRGPTTVEPFTRATQPLPLRRTVSRSQRSLHTRGRLFTPRNAGFQRRDRIFHENERLFTRSRRYFYALSGLVRDAGDSSLDNPALRPFLNGARRSGTEIACAPQPWRGDEENSHRRTNRCLRDSPLITALEAHGEEALQMVRHRDEHLSGHASASSSAVGPDQPTRLFYTSGL